MIFFFSTLEVPLFACKNIVSRNFKDPSMLPGPPDGSFRPPPLCLMPLPATEIKTTNVMHPLRSSLSDRFFWKIGLLGINLWLPFLWLASGHFFSNLLCGTFVSQLMADSDKPCESPCSHSFFCLSPFVHYYSIQCVVASFPILFSQFCLVGSCSILDMLVQRLLADNRTQLCLIPFQFFFNLFMENKGSQPQA